MKKLKIRKLYISIISLAVVVIAGVSTAYAILNTVTRPVVNKFLGSGVNIGVIEKGSVHEDSKTNEEIYTTLNKSGNTVDKVVTIQNMGGDSYVKVRLVPMIKNDQGQTLAKSINLTYNFAPHTNWKTDGNDVYYYSSELKAGQISEPLLNSITLNEDLPDGYHLELVVMSDAIAARPVENLQTAWGITDFSGMTSVN